MASSMQDEEVHHRKEEDLNIEEAKTDDDKKIVASESSETREAKKQKVGPEAKDANQEDDDNKIVAYESSATSEAEKKQLEPEVKDDANQEDEGTMMVVPSTTTSPRSLTQEEEDDSEQTLGFLSRWKAPETPPEKIIPRSLVEQCSRPIRKQLTRSDVRQNRLSLSNSQVRKKFQQILGGGSGKKNKEISRFPVYGPDGRVHEFWRGEKKSSFDLTSGWWRFVEAYGLKEWCDFVTVWMFRHRVTQRVCLGVDVARFAFGKEVSKRICEAALEDSD